MSEHDEELSADEATLAVLQHDSAWSWLHDEAENAYSEADLEAPPSA